uniref:Uncharacterized protein n=1 Tax=Panagrolaimus sp. ES5 TaxID=591445 RepID=A0AC34FJI0_9BILA
MLYKLLLLFVLSIVEINGNSCFNCVSNKFQNNFDNFIDVPRNSKIMFPLEKSDCTNPKRITCNGECVGVKIEKYTRGGEPSVGYLHGCAEHVLTKKFLNNSPVANFEKLCDKSDEFELSFTVKAKVTFCRCKEQMCNNPVKDFVNADYVAPPSSQISSSSSSRSEVNHSKAAISSSATSAAAFSSFISTSTAKTATLATTVIGTNALAISLSSNLQIDPLKFILPNLVAFLIYQMF